MSEQSVAAVSDGGPRVTVIERRTSATERAPDVPVLYRREPPVSRGTIAEWQRQIDEAVPVTEKLSRLVLRWEPGDPWQPVQRWVLWQCVDPRTHEIEPWILTELRGPSPRSSGHYCDVGRDSLGKPFCFCPLKRKRWVDGAAHWIDLGTWELYQETGLYGLRWWVIQGEHGGHRKEWAPDGVEAARAERRGLPNSPPRAGDLPYAPFDQRVIPKILEEKRTAQMLRVLATGAAREDELSLEEQREYEAVQREVLAKIDRDVEGLMEAGAGALPNYFEQEYGRVPTGRRVDVDYDAAEESFLTGR